MEQNEMWAYQTTVNMQLVYHFLLEVY